MIATPAGGVCKELLEDIEGCVVADDYGDDSVLVPFNTG